MPATRTPQLECRAVLPGVSRTGRALVVTAIVTAILSMVLLAGTVTGVGLPAAAAAKCADVEVVFARGTDEPPGIGRVGKSLVDALKPLVKGKSVHAYAVDYPASYDVLEVAAGANDASTHIQATAADCPHTKIVLGGYSQGAAVVDVLTTSPIAGFGFKAPLPAAVADHVAAVAVFGNPSARLGQPLTRLSALYGARTADLCNTADPICSLGDNLASHTTYPESGLVKTAAKWAADHVSASG